MSFLHCIIVKYLNKITPTTRPGPAGLLENIIHPFAFFYLNTERIYLVLFKGGVTVHCLCHDLLDMSVFKGHWLASSVTESTPVGAGLRLRTSRSLLSTRELAVRMGVPVCCAPSHGSTYVFISVISPFQTFTKLAHEKRILKDQ